MRRAAIVSPVRTPVGAFGGSLKSVAVEELGKTVVDAIMQRTGIDPALVDDVVFAQSYANSETPCVGRWIALAAGFPESVPGMQLDRRCGGGLQAVATAAMMVATGACDVVIAGGVESMSNIEHYATGLRWGKRIGSVKLYDRLDRGRERSQPESRFGYISGMVETAENLARRYNISREEADDYAVRSHRLAAAAWQTGKFADEVIPVSSSQAGSQPITVTKDEGVRPDTSLEKLGRLSPIIRGGTVTAGNASQQNDAAAACMIVAEDIVPKLGLEPAGYLVGWAASGCSPAEMGIGPVPAVAKLMQRAGLSLRDMDLVEINEAFACQVLAVLKEWRLETIENVNVCGSGISLGHPIAATGVRILVTLLHEMKRRGARYGLETMCVGGGQGVAAIFEAP